MACLLIRISSLKASFWVVYLRLSLYCVLVLKFLSRKKRRQRDAKTIYWYLRFSPECVRDHAWKFS